MVTRWHLSHRASPRGARLADRHYSRQKPGTPQFVKPGRCVVLITPDQKNLWVTSWPFAEFTKHKWAGAWECSLFRTEGDDLDSELNRQAVAATRAVFGDPPELGFISFIDPKKVRPVVVRGLPTFGYSWRAAGWKYVGVTQDGKLTFQMTPDRMPKPAPPVGFQPSLVEC
jgi:hypothetical protein